MIVKGNFHIIGERLKQKIFLWAAVFNATRPTVVLIKTVLDFMQYFFFYKKKFDF
jgi:hypothetical protein